VIAFTWGGLDFHEHQQEVLDVSFSPDESLVATANEDRRGWTRGDAHEHEHLFPGEKRSESLKLKVYLQNSL
jgi:hypothetical protein